MSLADYFETTEGTGVLATCDSRGNVDIAIYARPYVIDKNTIAFSMAERLSYTNIQSNPKAAYLFIEKGQGYKGKRLYLTKAGEESNSQRIKEIKSKRISSHKTTAIEKHLVYFTVDKTRPIVG
ncbi:MAG: pyridoxamine 5'-phosphate oxidase [Planctomycetes bacterium RBG_13_44_8b]|nr:MAG: pyridoxamine 5'-phosphate oxidase [Planctomycetes bacterium RBG_13_44_8b]